MKKQEKGLTLVALILALILILILMVHCMNLVINKKIIANADKSTNKYSLEEDKEKYEQLKAEYEIKKNQGNVTMTADEYILEKKYGLNLGDKVNYNELSSGIKTKKIDYMQNGGASASYNQELTTEDLEWRVIGINDNGQIELISTKPTQQTFYLGGEKGYFNVVDLLDSTCFTLYGQGENASSARGLKQEDINELANYDPITYEGHETISAYGVKWKYRYLTENKSMQYSTYSEKEKKWSNWIDITDASYQTFTAPRDTTISANNPGEREFISTHYAYFISNKIKYKIENNTISLADLITKGEGNSDYIIQYLASTRITCFDIKVAFAVAVLGSGSIGGANLRVSNDTKNYTCSYSFRPVVILNSDVQLEKDSNGVWQFK